MTKDAKAIGYRNPPQTTRFKKGTSGNPRGRPRKRGDALPYDAVLGRMITVREDGRERRVSAAEAFILHLTKKGLEGCGASARASLASIENARVTRGETGEERPMAITLCFFDISRVAEDLGMAVRLNSASADLVRVKLKAWIVEAALARMKPLHLSVFEQRKVVEATQNPAKVRWPDWWEVSS